VDSAAYADAVIPPYYDSMIAKLIVKGRDRAEAVGRMKRALEMFVIEGIKTSIPLHRRILADADFAAGKIDTHFIERLLERTENSFMRLVLPRLYVILDATLLNNSPHNARRNWPPQVSGCCNIATSLRRRAIC